VRWRIACYYSAFETKYGAEIFRLTGFLKAPRLMRGISLLAVIVGGVLDVALSSILGIVLGVYVIGSRGWGHLPADQLSRALVAVMHDDLLLRTAQLAIGFGCSVLGGFVAAWIAKERKLYNGVLASWLCVGIGLFTQFPDFTLASAVWQLVTIVLTPVCYLAGAYLRTKMWQSVPMKG
jgi:hypothetical protein